MKRNELPEQGFVFWPVGAGDSTTILVSRDIVVQVDINHLEAAESDDDPRYPMVDELVELLPRRGGRHYLTAFVATHADQDHCRGFRELLEDHEVLIGELWFTPRLVADIDADDPDNLSDDAKALRDEALRRIGCNVRSSARAGSGDRVRVIGYHDSLAGEFAELPDGLVTVPGNAVEVLDGTRVDDRLRIFVHSPFKDDMEAERNRTSIGLHVTLRPGGGRALLLGDLDYEPVKRLLETTKRLADREWDVFLAPHHCSKSVMYERVDGEDQLRKDVLDQIELAKAEHSWIVASSGPIPRFDSAGANPPHAKAKNRYSERCDTFLCTGEHPSKKSPQPLIFAATTAGLEFRGTSPTQAPGAATQIKSARGGTAPPAAPAAFGRC